MPETTTEAIEVTLNGEERRVPAGSVSDLLHHLGLQPGMIVVEHNREILARSAYGETRLREGDTLELVHFVGGG